MLGVASGKLVKALVNGEPKPGHYNLVWNRQDAKGRSCACGVYFCALAAKNRQTLGTRSETPDVLVMSRARFSRKVILTE
jgi:hypothetical protein